MVKLGAPSSSKLKALEDVDDEVRVIAPKELEAPDLAAEDIDLDDSDESDSDDK
jgi:hypothetical protein